MQLHPATAGIGAAVAGAGGSDPAPSPAAPRDPCSHQKEAANKTQRALILQHDIAVRSTEFSWNIRCKAQFPVAFKHYAINAQVVGVMDLLGKALVL